MEPTAQLKLSATLISRVGSWWAKRNDEAFKSARDEMFRAWTSELAVACREHSARLERLEKDLALVCKLEFLSDSQEFWRVLDNYGYEASREAIDERRKMLAWAAAGSITPDLTVPQLARVERTLRELDPGDLRVLRQLDVLEPMNQFVGPRESEWMAGLQARATERHRLWLETQPTGHVLTAAGCVSVQDVTFTFPTGTSLNAPIVVANVTVTELGRWILSVTDGFDVANVGSDREGAVD